MTLQPRGAESLLDPIPLLEAGRGTQPPTLARLVRNPGAVVGFVIVLFWVVMAVGARWFVPDPLVGDTFEMLAEPSGAHPMGTDSLGRDVFDRVLAGASSVLTIAPAATAICLVLGVAIGGVTAYRGGLLDEVVMRLMDAVMAFPVILIGLVLLGLAGAGRVTMILVIGVVFTPLVARTMRAAVQSVKDQEYVEAARLRGERMPYILVAEILPNVTAPLIVEATVRLASAVLAASALSFLGLGVQPPSPDWGASISTQYTFLQTAWWAASFPALALASLVVGVSLLAEGFKEVTEQ